MALAKDRRRRDVRFFGLFNCQAHGALVDDVTETPMPVDDRGRRRFLDDLPRRAGHDVADLDAFNISWDLDHPMRVMAGKVGVDHMTDDDLGLFRWSARRHE